MESGYKFSTGNPVYTTQMEKMVEKEIGIHDSYSIGICQK